jgi:hypothetical protein
MPSFLSNENINYLRFELRKIYPEDRWREIQNSTRDIVLEWFKSHPQLVLIYEQHGVAGLNKKFLSDVIAGPRFIDNPSMLDQDRVLYGMQDDKVPGNSFFTDTADPNIEQNQDMPHQTSWPYYATPSSLRPSQFMNSKKRSSISVGNKYGFTSKEYETKPRVNYAINRLQLGNNYTDEGAFNSVDGVSGLDSYYYTRDAVDRIGPSRRELTQAVNLNSEKWLTGSNLDRAIYNNYSYNGVPLTSNYMPGANCKTSVKETLTQLKFGDVPVISVLDTDELNFLGSSLHRMRYRPKTKRKPDYTEETERIDDVDTIGPRERFYLKELYNTPESRITTVMDPRLGRSRLTSTALRASMENPCSQDFIRNGQVYMPGNSNGSCPLSKLSRQPYPNKDFVPSKYKLEDY